MDDVDKTAGAQSLRRALHVLRLIGEHPADGMKLSAVIRASGLTRSTAHRLLSCLVEEHFVERDNATQNYRLGVDAMQIGFASMRQAPLISRLQPVMQKLARLTGDTLFLLVRQGDFSLCLHREEGHFPVKVFTTDVGERRLLGLGAGGLALMAELPDAEIAEIVGRNATTYAKSGFSLPLMMAAVGRTRLSGYAEIMDTVTKGVSGVGRTFSPSPSTLAALSIGAIGARLLAERRRELAQMLKEELRR
ncbi:MAG: IclR family transcriptional regulator [Pseudomonadota bacterium]